MDPVDNPYTPNAGATPGVLGGRDSEVQSFATLLKRLEKGRTDQSMIITGLRGVGKTVLLNEFRGIADKAKWHVIDFEASKHDDAWFRQTMSSQIRTTLLRISPRAKWSDRLKEAAAVLSSFVMSMDPDGAVSLSWDVPPAEGYADHGDLALDLTDVFVALGEAAKEHKTGVVILVDEVQFLTLTQLESVIQAVHKTVQRSLPITFVGAGLPQIAELAGDAKSYAERLFRFPEIGSLEADDARHALVEPAREEGAVFDDDAVDLALEITHGYPYFIQELGYQVWAVARDGRITRADIATAREAYDSNLDSSFFRVRLDRATPLQTAYMRAMAELGPEPQKAADVAEVMGRTSSQVAPVRAELINMGLLYTPQHGYAAFTVPDFDAFIMRTIPELEVPEPRRARRKRA